MAKKLFALLVGIDDYPSPVPKLGGCVNDIEAVEQFLRQRVGGIMPCRRRASCSTGRPGGRR